MQKNKIQFAANIIRGVRDKSQNFESDQDVPEIKSNLKNSPENISGSKMGNREYFE